MINTWELYLRRSELIEKLSEPIVFKDVERLTNLYSIPEIRDAMNDVMGNPSKSFYNTNDEKQKLKIDFDLLKSGVWRDYVDKHDFILTVHADVEIPISANESNVEAVVWEPYVFDSDVEALDFYKRNQDSDRQWRVVRDLQNQCEKRNLDPTLAIKPWSKNFDLIERPNFN